MKRSTKILIVGILAWALLAGSMLQAAWFTDQVLKVNKYATFGTSTKRGKVTIQNYVAADDALNIRLDSAQTGEAIDVTNSSGTTLFKVDKDGDVTAVSVAFSGAVTSTAGITETYQLKVDQVDSMSDVVALSVSMSSLGAQTADIFQFLDGTTEMMSMTSAGQLDIAGAAVVGGTLAVTSTSTLTGAATATNSIVVNQVDTLTSVVPLTVGMSSNGGQTADALQVLDGSTELFSITAGGQADFAGAVVVGTAITLGTYIQDTDGYTSDPCITALIGIMFYNKTASEWCACDGSTDDVRIKDYSTACF